ncbi:MAG: TerB family tellurite resistance protein [Vicinamibacteria bacterium]|nr:TerB family tellurite resistance protein [Vicinamibacteria bacterium]
MPGNPAPSEIEAALLQAIHEFFEERTAATAEVVPEAETVRDGLLQLAATVLFLQMIAADHGSRHDEHKTLLSVLSRVLRVEGEQAAIIIRAAEQHVKKPLKKLLRVLRERCTPLQKKKVVESMWRLAFADAELAGQEEYFVRKVSESLGLSTADLVEAKILAREAFLGPTA